MKWILDKIRGTIANKYTASFVRTLLQLAAGYLVAQGVSAEQAENFRLAAEPVLTGLALSLLTQFWSWLDKAKNQPPKPPEPILPDA